MKIFSSAPPLKAETRGPTRNFSSAPPLKAEAQKVKKKNGRSSPLSRGDQACGSLPLAGTGSVLPSSSLYGFSTGDTRALSFCTIPEVATFMRIQATRKTGLTWPLDGALAVLAPGASTRLSLSRNLVRNQDCMYGSILGIPGIHHGPRGLWRTQGARARKATCNQPLRGGLWILEAPTACGFGPEACYIFALVRSL